MPKGAFWKVGLGSALLLLVSAAPGWCGTVSLVLASNSGGVYDYSLVFGSTGVSFFAGDGIFITGDVAGGIDFAKVSIVVFLRAGHEYWYNFRRRRCRKLGRNRGDIAVYHAKLGSQGGNPDLLWVFRLQKG